MVDVLVPSGILLLEFAHYTLLRCATRMQIRKELEHTGWVTVSIHMIWVW